MSKNTFIEQNSKIKKNDIFAIISSIYEWIASWKFPVFFISFLIFFVILTLSILLIPPDDTNSIGKFAKTFRIWCFGLNPDTEKDQNIYLIMFILDPLLLILLILFFWIEPLKKAIQNQIKDIYKYTFYGFLPVGFFALFFLYLAYFENPEFEYNLKTLRIQVPIKPVKLLDQNGNMINISDYKGNVLIITSFYSHCHYMCPAILKNVKDIVQNVKDKSRLKIFAITMDPERDTIDRLKITSEIFDMKESYYHFLTGDKEIVNEYLDVLNFQRQYIPEKGEFNHANILLIVDKNNKIAYRFTINKEQKELATQAIEHLLKE